MTGVQTCALPISIKLEILENHTVKMISENVINTDFSWQLTNETITIKEIEEECRGFTMTGIVGNNKITGQMETTGEKSKSDGICPLHGTWQVVKKN